MARLPEDDGFTDANLHPRQQAELFRHQETIDTINPRQQQRGHHAFILSGPRGIGKATAAYHLAKSIFAGDAGPGLFGEAPVGGGWGDDAETRLIEAGSHPDMLVLEPDPSKATEIISVEQVRKISQFLSHSPKRGDWRMVMVDSLDAVNFNGANAMLKTLEEPPERSVIVLIHHQTKPVLPTIRSRCRLVRMLPLDFNDARSRIVAMYPEADPNWVDVATVLADGAPGKAYLFAESGAADLYAETAKMLAANEVSLLAIDDLARSWGAAGAANLSRRHSAKLVFDRLLTEAVRASAGIRAGRPGARLDIEDMAIDAITRRHDADRLASLHQQLIRDLDEAERLNLDQGIIFHQLLNVLLKQG